MEIKLNQQQKELIERFGVFMEQRGVAPVQARITCLLMICDHAELTFDEIYMTLKISKSAASNAINTLLMMGKIEYYTKPGDRKRYFRSKVGQIESDFENSFSKLLEIRTLFREILAIRPKNTREFNARLQRVIDFMEFLQQELPDVYKKWRKLNK
jgi:DNA-binding transcriptional regulator GbsR (MarR family)